MTRRLMYAVLGLVALAAPAAAQGYEPGTLPPQEVLRILRSTGLDPIGQPMRRGPNYVLRAVDDSDREVSVVVSARGGRVLSVTPVQTASRLPPGVSMGPYERMPQGYIPPGAYRPSPLGGPPVTEDDDDGPDIANPNVPTPLGSVPGAQQPRSSSAVRPPYPRGGATLPNGNDNDASLSEPNVITADPDRSGMLPPPPERFPQRATTPVQPKPKPVKRAAAAPPKQAPLPKPKPAANAEAPPAPPTAAWPTTAEPAPAPAKTPAAEETPH